jgi:hypothetical protein
LVAGEGEKSHEMQFSGNWRVKYRISGRTAGEEDVKKACDKQSAGEDGLNC